MRDTDLFGEPVINGHKSVLARTFDYPPFSVLNAREGWWQERKRQWLALGIKSEVGRGSNALQLSEQCEQYRKGEYEAIPGGGCGPDVWRGNNRTRLEYVPQPEDGQ